MSAAAPLAVAPAALPSIGGAVLSLFLVLGLVIALGWIARRLSAGRGMLAQGPLRVRASLALGMKERLVLVEAAGENLLLGVGAAGMTCLHRFDGPLPAEPEQTAGFAALLQRVGRGKDRGDA